MSRIANNPITVPSGVDINVSGQQVTVKGKQGSMEHSVHENVVVSIEEQQVKIAARDASKRSRALAGTSRAVLNNMVTGVSEGFERRLLINGVGYRAAVQGKTLNLTLGFSHPVEYPIPEGITIETPSQTEVVIKGMDKQRVGQVAANIRAYRPPEPYKGKGVKYADENIVRKEAKKT
ncbi:MAG: 50S ribosomal protein L6 [Gammaproteobacteria bacterium]|nr:50S ribosomal protein L6 [Gammaproteobacteria bacterium]NNL99753.1 50S ribosomal protein L6 [Gammaproteobacteria bacterium]